MAKHRNDSRRKSTLLARRRAWDSMDSNAQRASKRPGSNKK